MALFFGRVYMAVVLLLLLVAVAALMPSPACPIAEGDSCAEVKFYLWTRLNPDEPQLITAANVSSSGLNRSHPTRMVMHGYASGMDLPQLAAIRQEYLLHSPHNLISPQYLELVDSPCYLTAVVNLDYIGKCIARFIRALNIPRRERSTATTTSPTDAVQVLDLHLIGFSLGAQATAFVANHLRPEYLLDRITGLDPALPLFMTSNADRKLNAGDAVFVDVVHTNAFVQGQGSPCGRLDFYMNGGVAQPGCDQGFFARLKCDHHRAPTYFAESVRSAEGFWGWPCGAIADYDMGRCPAPATGPAVLAGAWADRRSAGFYIVETRSAEPFARGRWWAESGEEETST